MAKLRDDVVNVQNMVEKDEQMVENQYAALKQMKADFKAMNVSYLWIA